MFTHLLLVIPLIPHLAGPTFMIYWPGSWSGNVLAVFIVFYIILRFWW